MNYRQIQITAVVLCLFLSLAPAWADGPAGRLSVVLLHDVDRPDARTRSMGQGLAEVLAGRGDILSVALGSQARGDEHFHARFETLRPDWGRTAPTAVIADGEAAFAFVRKYRDDFFAYAPVIYCGMAAPDPEYLRQCGDCTGLPETPDAAAAADLIFRLRPDTGLVVGIMDGSPESAALRQAAERAVAQAVSAGRSHAQAVFPGHEPGDDAGLTLRSLRGMASSIPATGAALFLGFAKDAQGRTVDQDGDNMEIAAVRLLTSRCSGPVFALTDRWMDPGADQGIAAAVTVPGQRPGRGPGRACPAHRGRGARQGDAARATARTGRGRPDRAGPARGARRAAPGKRPDPESGPDPERTVGRDTHRFPGPGRGSGRAGLDLAVAQTPSSP